MTNSDTPTFHTRQCSFSSRGVYSWNIFLWVLSILSQTNCFDLPSSRPKSLFFCWCYCFPTQWSYLTCHQSDSHRLQNLLDRTPLLLSRRNDLLPPQEERDSREIGAVFRTRPSSESLQTGRFGSVGLSCGGILEAQRHATGRKFMN